MRARQALSGLFAIVLCSTLVWAGSPAGAQAACAAAGHPGGDWPSYGHDLSNTRSQPLESGITGGKAATLTSAWSFSVTLEGDTGLFNNTPVVAGGCVYAITTTGWVYALNADTGELVWKTKAGASSEPTLAVGGGKVIAHVGSALAGGPQVVALDQATGGVAWATVISTLPNAGFTSSPVVFDGQVFSGILEGLEFTPEFRETTNGSFALLDLATGAMLKKTHVIPAEDFANGYSGGNIWATAVVDLGTGYAYVGTAATYNREKEHPRTNAILKIDVDRQSATFGEIVDFYSGVRDYYFDINGELPCIPLVEGSNNLEGLGSCTKMDHDFGGSPVLYPDSQGRTIVGEAQGSGVFHALDSTTMEPAWTALVSAPGAARVSTAADDAGLYSAEITTGTVYSLERDTGNYRWMVSSVDSFHYSPPSVANGVVYATTNTGMLVALDGRTAFPLLYRPMHPDAGGPAPGLGTGVAIARGTVYTVGGGSVLAYRPDPALAMVAELFDTTVLPAIPTPPVLPRQEKPV